MANYPKAFSAFNYSTQNKYNKVEILTSVKYLNCVNYWEWRHEIMLQRIFSKKINLITVLT